MASLQPGANASLTLENPGLSDLVVGFGWDVVQGRGPQVELVPSAIVVDAQGRALSDEHFVFFNQLSTPDGSIQQVEGEQDVDQVELALGDIPEAVAKVVFLVFVDPEIRQPGDFSSVRNGHIRVMDRSLRELVRFDLPRQDPGINVLVFGEVYRHRTEWKFRAVGQGFTGGIVQVAQQFGVTI